MNLLSAKNVFSDIFEWFASLSSKLPAIDYKTYFIVVVALLLGVGLVVALTYFGSYRFKLLIACKKIIGYLADVEAIDNDNFGDFTAQCFSAKVPSTLRDCWVQYLGVRFGYPSDIVSEQNVYDKEVKRVREIRANVFIAVALILIAIFSFWGYGRLDGNDMGVIFLTGLLLSGVIYLVLVILNKMLSNKCLDVFNNMQEDLDAKVIFQVEKSFATDSSPLGDLAAIIDEIVARNTAKDIGFEFADEQTPIEELIANADGSVGDSLNDSEFGSVADEAEEGNSESNPVSEESVPEEPLDGEPENMTIDDIIIDETVSVGEENEDDCNSVNAETNVDANADENIVEESDIAEPIVEESNDATSDASEQTTVDDAINGVVEDEQEEIEKVADEVIDGEPVEIINENDDEKQEDKDTPEANEQKKNLSDNEDLNASDIDEQIVEEQPMTDAAEQNVDDNPPVDSTEQTEQPVVQEDKEESPKVEKQGIKSGDSNDSADDDEPIIQYVMDGPMDDDDDIVKPAQLVKMPNLVDYIIAQNASPKIKMKIVNKLLASYKKFEDSEEDKQIIIDCVKKLMADLQSKK